MCGRARDDAALPEELPARLPQEDGAGAGLPPRYDSCCPGRHIHRDDAALPEELPARLPQEDGAGVGLPPRYHSRRPGWHITSVADPGSCALSPLDQGWVKNQNPDPG